MMAAVSIFFTKLESRGALAISGADSHKFLQGQTTCDLGRLQPDQSINGAFCNPQGRVICDFRLLATPQSCLLLMHRDICEPAAAVFSKYIVFSKATLQVATSWEYFAVWGETAAATLQLHNGVVGRCWEVDNSFWIQTDDAGERFEACVPSAAADEFQQALQILASHENENSWRRQDIAAGLAHIETQTMASFVPHMLNYQATDHISFKKGCYTGQEVVARMHYKAKLKRSLFIASVATSQLPLAGTALYAADGEQSVGDIVNAAHDAEQALVLAVVSVEAATKDVHLGAKDGPLLKFQALPYPVAR